MDLSDTPELADYRANVRAWLDEHKGEAPKLVEVLRRLENARKRLLGGTAEAADRVAEELFAQARAAG